MPEDTTHALAGSGAGFRELIEKSADGVLLVRPDGVVGWRSEGVPPDPNAAVASARARCLTVI